MESKITLFIVSIIFFIPVYSQTDNVILHYSTEFPQNGRFEIISSSILRRDTYKLDKFTGKVYQIVETPMEEKVWNEITILQHPQDSSSYYSYPVYQLFISGLTAKDIFLINTKNGAIWNLVRDPTDDELFFNPLITIYSQ